MPVYRPHIGDPQLLEDMAGDDVVAQHLSDLLERPVHLAPDHGDGLNQALDLLLGPLDDPGRTYAGEIAGQGPDRLGDGPLIVVQDDQQRVPQGPRMVDCLERNSGAETGVSNDGDCRPGFFSCCIPIESPKARLTLVPA